MHAHAKGLTLEESSKSIVPQLPDSSLWACSYADVNVTTGSAIRFVWPGQHGVYRIPSGNCPPQYFPGDGFQEIAPIDAAGGNVTTEALDVGSYWYACQVRTAWTLEFQVQQK